MGCDIHMYVEQRQADGTWTYCPEPKIAAFQNQDGSDYMVESWYFGRNYTLFGYLADVRNDLGYGTSRVRPIDTPRGIPADASPEYKKIAGPWCGSQDCEGDGHCGWGQDGHSHSYFTLRELVLAAQAEDRTVDHRGWVTPSEYAAFLATGQPSSWCGGVGGGNVQHISNAEMQRLIVAHPELTEQKRHTGPHPSYYTEIRWQTTINDSLGGDWQEFLKRLGELTYDDGSDVRAVFFFDN